MDRSTWNTPEGRAQTCRNGQFCREWHRAQPEGWFHVEQVRFLIIQGLLNCSTWNNLKVLGMISAAQLLFHVKHLAS